MRGAVGPAFLAGAPGFNPPNRFEDGRPDTFFDGWEPGRTR